MLHRETLTLVAMLAPNLLTFRHMQCTHQTFHVSTMCQFMIRSQWRTVNKSDDVICTILPNKMLDGIYIRAYAGRVMCSDVCAYRNGMRWGAMLSYHITGNLYTRATYIADKLTGKYISYWISGAPRTNLNYVDDALHGICVYYHTTGEVYSWCEFVNGKLEGNNSQFYKSGQLSSRSMCVNGVRHGESTCYYETGTLRIRDQYANGKINGESRIYYPTGELCRVNNFVDNVQCGEQFHYYKSGQLCERVVFNRGRVIKRIRYDKAGSIIY